MKLKWSDLEPHEQNALIAEHVFGRTIYRHNTWGRWLLYHETKPGLTEAIPDYTHNWNEAWTVLQAIAARFNEQAKIMDEVFYDFRHLLLNDSGDEIWTATELLLDMAKWTPETLCIAALRASGLEIEE